MIPDSQTWVTSYSVISHGEAQLQGLPCMHWEELVYLIPISQQSAKHSLTSLLAGSTFVFDAGGALA